jgi:hypothetical protein
VRRLRNIAILCAGYLFFLWQCSHPVFRFEWPFANDVAGLLLAVALPWLAMTAVVCYERWWTTAIGMIAALPLLLYSFAVLLFALPSWPGAIAGHDPGFDQFAETRWQKSVIRLYRTDGGATTDFGVVVRQERDLVPGILLVRTIDSYYPCDSVVVRNTSGGIVITEADDYRADSPQLRHEYRLKPLICF